MTVTDKYNVSPLMQMLGEQPCADDEVIQALDAILQANTAHDNNIFVLIHDAYQYGRITGIRQERARRKGNE